MQLYPLTIGFPTQTITVTGSSVATALTTDTTSGPMQCELQNAGSAVVFIAFGASGVTTTVATGYPIIPGHSKVVSIPANCTHIAAISGTAGQTLYVTQGRGF